MAVTNGPQLGIIADAPAGEIAPNEWRKLLRALDAFMFFSVKSATTNAQPGSPANGDRYIMTAAASGADWAGQAAGTIAVFTTQNTITTGGAETTTSAWEFYTPKLNWFAFVENATNALMRYTGTVWTGNIRAAEGFDIPTGKAYKVNAVQVLAGVQSGMGATLAAATAGATYTSAEQAMLQAVYNKMVSLETKSKAHGFVAT